MAHRGVRDAVLLGQGPFGGELERDLAVLDPARDVVGDRVGLLTVAGCLRSSSVARRAGLLCHGHGSFLAWLRVHPGSFVRAISGSMLRASVLGPDGRTEHGATAAGLARRLHPPGRRIPDRLEATRTWRRGRRHPRHIADRLVLHGPGCPALLAGQVTVSTASSHLGVGSGPHRELPGTQSAQPLHHGRNCRRLPAGSCRTACPSSQRRR